MMARATASALSALAGGATRLALATTLVAVAPSFAAGQSARQIPARDDAIVEHLPTHMGDAA